MPLIRHGLLVLLGSLSLACAATGPPVARPDDARPPDGPSSAPSAAAGGAAVVAAAAPLAAGAEGGWVMLEIGGHKIHARQVVELLLERDREAVDKALKDLMVRDVLAREAAELNVRVAQKLLDDSVARDLKRAENYARTQYQMGFAEFLKRQGRDLAAFKKTAREKALADHTLARLVRHEQMRQGMVKVRHIVVKDRALAEQIRSKLTDGADFGTLCKQHSTCQSRQRGGLLPMVVPGFYPDAVEQAVFKMQPRELSPLVQTEAGWHILRVVARHDADSAAYTALEPAIAASLRKHPVEDVEINWWLSRLRKKYPIKQHF